MVTRPNEYGIEETVADLVPAPPEVYSTQSAYVPPVLAKWLRPHQREGVLFMVSMNLLRVCWLDYDGILETVLGLLDTKPTLTYFCFVMMHSISINVSWG
jgi:hypothetical protein